MLIIMIVNIENARALMEDFENKPDDFIEKDNFCQECQTDMILTTHGHETFYCCYDCGQTSKINVIDSYYRESVEQIVQIKQLYKRRRYCIEKLKLIACFKQARSPKYKDIMKQIKNEQFDTIDELYQIMKEFKFSKFYKYIYNIWNDIKKSKLITLSFQEIDFLSDRFVEIDILFKKNKTTQKNMLSYNSIIYYLMKKYKLKGYSHILLPYNHSKIYKNILIISRK